MTIQAKSQQKEAVAKLLTAIEISDQLRQECHSYATTPQNVMDSFDAANKKVLEMWFGVLEVMPELKNAVVKRYSDNYRPSTTWIKYVALDGMKI